ncbi:MAG: outer membrane protein assembly factor BamA [Candidatus Adiutrix sp.]|jgi:outer membrane protein insertion porin family|nr:outer membrane protein assembly factor BamA [Candidatus Adiutrix sp.]
MKKFAWLMMAALAALLTPGPLQAQEGARVAVLPLVMSADKAQLEQLSRLSKGLMSVVTTGLADQGFMAIPLGDNLLAVDEESAKAQAREMGADYLFSSRVNKSGDRFNLTGQLQALTAAGKSSKRISVTADSAPQLPQAAERLIYMTTDHLTEAGVKVVSVDVSGNTMLDSQAILNALRIRPGGTYNEAKATSDLKRVYALGYFEDVQIETKEVGGGVAVHFRVKERAQLANITFRGNKKFEEEDLLKVIGIKPKDIPSERNIADSVENIKRLYVDKGFPNVQVMTSVESDGDGQGLLVYDISEGGKIYIKEIVFDGNDFYSDWTLSGKIETSTRNFLISWISGSGKLNQEKLSGDSQRLESFYHNTGFMQAQVGEPSVSTADDGSMTITFPIVEGERFKVGEVTLGGQPLEDDDINKILKSVEIRKEEWFSREVMQEDVKALQTYYSDKGYAHNSVEPRITGPHDDNRLDVEFVVQPNNKVYFDRITIVGNEKTRDKVIRRQLAVVEGDLFSSSKIQASQANLMRSSYFEQANLVPGPSDTDEKMNLRVEVKERPTGSFQIGGGYSNYNSLFGVIKVTQDNLFGYGRRVSVEANVGSKNSYYDISFTDPWVFDIPLTLGFDLFNYENEYDYYTKGSNGVALRAGYPVWGNFYLSARYSLEKIDITDVDTTASEYLRSMMDYSTDSILTLTLRRDTRNHFFFPTEGSVARLSYAKASSLFGGDTDFSRYEVEGAVWIPAPFWKGASLMFHGETGYMTEDADKGLPTYEKYMLGGINSVRGYDWYSISPRDNRGQTIGGEKMLVLNAEVAFPILKEQGLYAVAFFDAGNVWAKNCKSDMQLCKSEYSLSDLRKSYGGGLRYLSPMGPFRIEYGIPLDKDQYSDSSGQWEFTMGSMF